jgi:5'-nucleotidase
MRILITNDDGYNAPGLTALYHALKPLGTITVVAPAVCHSSKSHAVSTDAPIRVDDNSLEDIGPVHVVHACPADCVRIGTTVIMDATPDLVVAGINPGANMGVDVYYSGTVAAAREAAILGHPAIAVSQYVKKGIPLNWKPVTLLAQRAIQRICQEPQRPGQFWNLNLPVVAPDQAPKSFAFLPHSIEPQMIRYRSSTNGQTGHREVTFTGEYTQRPAQQEADVKYIFDGHVTATPLCLDLTSPHHALPSHEDFDPTST